MHEGYFTQVLGIYQGLPKTNSCGNLGLSRGKNKIQQSSCELKRGV